MRSGAASGAQVAMSPSSKRACGRRCLALASIGSELSVPTSAAAGKRRTSSSVELPGPQPRSTTRCAFASGTRASSSRAGRVRSSSKRLYSAGFHSLIALALQQVGDARLLFFQFLQGQVDALLREGIDVQALDHFVL